MIAASTLAGLGQPDVDGAQGVIRIGTRTLERLTWNLAEQVWIGRPRTVIAQKDTQAMGAVGSVYPALGYVSGAIPDDNPPMLNVNGWGFPIAWMDHAREMYDAGFRLQEHLSAFLRWSNDGAPDEFLVLNWYAFDPDSQFLSPATNNLGLRLPLKPIIDRWYFVTTGWQNSPIAKPSEPAANGITWYPEMYGRNVFSVKNAIAKVRWVGGADLSGTVTPDPRPTLDRRRANIGYLYDAENLGPLLDGTPVASWEDVSGWFRNLRQATSSKRPIYHAAGGPNDKPFVRFDGTNDSLVGSDAWASPDANYTWFLVFRQRAGGGDTQVWLDGRTGGFLAYRADSVDSVHIWNHNGGGDLVYARGGNWGTTDMPWVCLNVVQTPSAVKVYENETLKIDSANVGTSGPAGLIFGARSDESLFSRLDLAAFVMYGEALSDSDRVGVLDWLNAKYALF